jgi:nucleotide-binding universal stress UspA family protein
MIKNILIPTDGSDYSKTAIAYGIFLARKVDAHLIGLHVVDIRLMQGPVCIDISTPGPSQSSGHFTSNAKQPEYSRS